MRKRSITIDGHQTSVSLEDEFWHELAAIAERRKLSLNALVTEIDRQRATANGSAGNLSSRLRIYVLQHAKGNISPA